MELYAASWGEIKREREIEREGESELPTFRIALKVFT